MGAASSADARLARRRDLEMKIVRAKAACAVGRSDLGDMRHETRAAYEETQPHRRELLQQLTAQTELLESDEAQVTLLERMRADVARAGNLENRVKTLEEVTRDLERARRDVDPERVAYVVGQYKRANDAMEEAAHSLDAAVGETSKRRVFDEERALRLAFGEDAEHLRPRPAAAASVVAAARAPAAAVEAAAGHRQ